MPSEEPAGPAFASDEWIALRRAAAKRIDGLAAKAVAIHRRIAQEYEALDADQLWKSMGPKWAAKQYAERDRKIELLCQAAARINRTIRAASYALGPDVVQAEAIIDGDEALTVHWLERPPPAR